MIKQNVNFDMFLDSFSDTYKNNFTYEGKRALFEYLEQLSDDIGEDIELDTVALCCEYDEYENFDDIRDTYSDYFKKHNINSIEDLQEHTQVIELSNNNGYIIASF